MLRTLYHHRLRKNEIKQDYINDYIAKHICRQSKIIVLVKNNGCWWSQQVVNDHRSFRRKLALHGFGKSDIFFMVILQLPLEYLDFHTKCTIKLSETFSRPDRIKLASQKMTNQSSSDLETISEKQTLIDIYPNVALAQGQKSACRYHITTLKRHTMMNVPYDGPFEMVYVT